LALLGCATRAEDVKPAPANPADFVLWGCDRIHDEADRVQQQAAELAYAVDERAGQNIMALGLGVTVFWPAMLAMRPVGLEAEELARFKGRYEALLLAAKRQGCAPASTGLPAAQAAQLSVALGDRLVYEVRTRARGPLTQEVLRVAALRRTEFVYQMEPASATAPARAPAGAAPAPAASPAAAPAEEQPLGEWVQDRAGNVVQAPVGAMSWPRLLRSELTLGQVTAGDIVLVGDPLSRARMRGQVVALGPQTVAGRKFNVVVVELFGDAPGGEAYTRVDGALVVDRTSGVLLRLDLRSANPVFQVQRRLVRVEAAAAP
jgi:biotin carboxyl carrier protein